MVHFTPQKTCRAKYTIRKNHNRQGGDIIGKTSNESKQQWNKTHYTQVKVSVSPDIAADFKLKCAAANVSVASELSRFMSGQTGGHSSKIVSLETRQHRRRAVKILISQAEAILDAEQRYMDNIPQNLQNSNVYETAEQTISALEEVVSILEDAY
jgi:hypothetical protein